MPSLMTFARSFALIHASCLRSGSVTILCNIFPCVDARETASCATTMVFGCVKTPNANSVKTKENMNALQDDFGGDFAGGTCIMPGMIVLSRLSRHETEFRSTSLGVKLPRVFTRKRVVGDNTSECRMKEGLVDMVLIIGVYFKTWFVDSNSCYRKSN